MISSTLLNLILAIVAVGMLVPVLRVAYLAASGRFEAAPLDEQMDTSYDLERAA